MEVSEAQLQNWRQKPEPMERNSAPCGTASRAKGHWRGPGPIVALVGPLAAISDRRVGGEATPCRISDLDSFAWES